MPRSNRSQRTSSPVSRGDALIDAANALNMVAWSTTPVIRCRSRPGRNLPAASASARSCAGGANQGDFKVGHLNLSGYNGGNIWANTYSGLGHACVMSFYIQPLDDTTDLGYSALPALGTAVTCRIF